MPTDHHSRRELLRRLGMLGAVGIGATAPFSGAVGAADAASDAFEERAETTIPSFDGAELAIKEYVPTGSGPFPAVLITHGWANDLEEDGVTALAELYASDGYLVLTYDSRGFGASEGVVGVNGPNEIGDVQALLDYLADHEAVQSDGDDPVVGMDGFSYAGEIQLRAAAADDRIDAIIPRWAWHDLRFSNDPNGVVKWPWVYLLNVSGLLGSLGLIPNPGRGLDYEGDGVPDLQQAFLELGKTALGEGAASEALREFWASRSPGPAGDLDAIDAPTLLIHGWHDRLFTPNEAFANYRGIKAGGTETKLVMYDGGHDLVGAPGDSEPAQLRFLAGAALRFFRRHLKDEPVPDEKRLSPVTLYRAGTGTFDSFKTLPTGERTLSLRDSAGPGTTRLTTAPGGTAVTTFAFDVTESLDLAGAGELRFRVTPRGDRPILSAALAKEGSGSPTPLKDQVAVTPVEAQGTTTVSLDLIGVEATFEPGDTLQVLVGVRDDQLAPFLKAANIREAFPDSLLKQVEAYLPETIPDTDGLYFDSPTTPATGVVIHHTRPAESTVTLRTLTDTAETADDAGAADHGRETTRDGRHLVSPGAALPGTR